MSDKIEKYEKKGDSLDSYRAFLIEGKNLTAKQEEYFEKLEQANALLCAGYSPSNAVEILAKKYGNTTRGMWNVITDSQEIWGDVKKTSKDGQRHVMYENFMRIARKLENMGDFEGAGKNFERAAKLYMLFDGETQGIDAAAFLQPVQINYSNNFNILNQRDEYEETE